MRPMVSRGAGLDTYGFGVGVVPDGVVSVPGAVGVVADWLGLLPDALEPVELFGGGV